MFEGWFDRQTKSNFSILSFLCPRWCEVGHGFPEQTWFFLKMVLGLSWVSFSVETAWKARAIVFVWTLSRMLTAGGLEQLLKENPEIPRFFFALLKVAPFRLVGSRIFCLSSSTSHLWIFLWPGFAGFAELLQVHYSCVLFGAREDTWEMALEVLRSMHVTRRQGLPQFSAAV